MQSAPELGIVLDAVDDGDCRRIIRVLDRAMTAKEISERCNLPLSTTYRKLELLTAATLVDEETRIRDGGHHTREFVTAFESIRISLEASRDLEIAIDGPAQTAKAQLTTIWNTVRETV